MKEIASRGNITDDSLIEYVIDGVDKSNSDKAILYGAETIKEFKIKLRHFEKMREKISTKVVKDKDKDGKKSAYKNDRNKLKDKNKCYNCGELNHKSADCNKAKEVF